MTDQTGNSNDLFLRLAYWTNVAMSVIAVILTVFLLLLLAANTPAEATYWNALRPTFFAVICWLYLDILTREYWQSMPQRPQRWLISVTITGVMSLLVFANSILRLPHGPSPVLLIPLLIGCLSAAAVGRIVLRNVWSDLRRESLY